MAVRGREGGREGGRRELGRERERERERWGGGSSIIIRVKRDINYFSVAPETGGIMITPRPSPDDSPPKPSFPSRPFWGIQPVLINAKVRWETHRGWGGGGGGGGGGGWQSLMPWAPSRHAGLHKHGQTWDQSLCPL